jgi:predicted nucleic acid-binding protein
MKRLIIADTGYVVALANPKDYYHSQALSVSQKINDNLITTWPVITETCHFLNKRISPKSQASL